LQILPIAYIDSTVGTLNQQYDNNMHFGTRFLYRTLDVNTSVEEM